MTLAFALRGCNGLVLGSDSRMSGQQGSADTSTKFLQINREIGVLTYGSAEAGYKAITKLYDSVNKTSEFSTTQVKRLVYFTEIANEAERIFKETYQEWISKLEKAGQKIKPNDPRFATGFILAGYDANETNQFKVLWWDSTHDFQRAERPDILAAQWFVSQYLVANLYYPEMTVEQLKRLGVFLLVETEIVSPSVGGQVQMATVALESGFQRLNEKEVQEIIDENQWRFAEFRKILLDELR